MTLESKEIIKVMLKNDGVFPGDPQVYSIYSYVSRSNTELFAVFMENFHFDLDVSPYVKTFKLLWSKGLGLTPAGRALLEQKEKRSINESI